MNRYLLEAAATIRRAADAHPLRPGAPTSGHRWPWPTQAQSLTVEFYLYGAAGDYVLAVACAGAEPDRAACDELRAALGGPILLTRWYPPYERGDLIVRKLAWRRAYADLAGARADGSLEGEGETDAFV